MNGCKLMSKTRFWSRNVHRSCTGSAADSWPLQPPYFFRKVFEELATLWYFLMYFYQWMLVCRPCCVRSSQIVYTPHQWSFFSTLNYRYVSIPRTGGEYGKYPVCREFRFIRAQRSRRAGFHCPTVVRYIIFPGTKESGTTSHTCITIFGYFDPVNILFDNASK